MTASKHTIREATAADLPALVALLAQLRDDPADEEYGGAGARYAAALAEIGRDSRQKLMVLESRGELLATGVVVIVPNLTHGGRPYALLENIVTDAGHRGQRLGEQLVLHMVEQARAAGCYKAALMSNLRREDAHRFYERIGFRFAHKGFRIDL